MAKAAMITELKLDPAYEHQQSALHQIIIKVIEQYAMKVLRYDEQIAPFVIKELENRDSYTPLFTIEVEGKEEQVRLMGIIDRVDVHLNKTRIVDYKTGKDQLKYTDFDALFDEESKGQNKALLQTLFYTFVYEKAINVSHVEPHLYTVKDFKEGTQFIEKGKDKVILADENLADLKDQFALRLKEKLNELFDQSIPFRQTVNIESCTYCAFKEICQR
jgi:RecB family exonuclease